MREKQFPDETFLKTEYTKRGVQRHVSKRESLGTYTVYGRHPAYFLDVKNQMTTAQQETEIESVLDMADIPWIPKKALRHTVVDKIKMNDDHQMIAFTVDIGNNERCTGGIKNMKTQKVIANIKLEGISQMEFFGKDQEGHDVVYYA